jgi:uncharacterized membrane protein YphA (DoxX/SURF4 family)
MLSIFPPLLSYSGFAPLLLRLLLGTILVLWAYNHFKSQDKIYILEGVLGTLLILGLATQLAALASTILLGVRIYFKIKRKEFLTDGVNYYLILFVISLGLIVSGAGYLSFDLPL